MQYGTINDATFSLVFFFPLTSRIADSRRVSLKIDLRSKCWTKWTERSTVFIPDFGIRQIPAASIIDAPIVHRSNFTSLVITRVDRRDGITEKPLLSRAPIHGQLWFRAETNSWIRERLIGRELKVPRHRAVDVNITVRRKKAPFFHVHWRTRF